MKRKDRFNSKSPSKKTKNEQSSDEIVGECQACTEPSTILLPNCKHSYCNSCFTQSFKTAIDQGNYYDKICCGPLPDSMIKEYLPSSVYSDYQNAKTQSKHLKRTCFSCQSDILIPPENANRGSFVCECGSEICINCNNAKHDGECTFTDIEEMLKNLAKESGWAKCPRCAFTVEKIKGCCYTKCTCKAEFCNRCSRAWRKAEGEAASRFHKCYYCSQVVISYEFDESEDDKREYHYKVVSIKKDIYTMAPENVLSFLDRAEQWTKDFVPKKGNYKKDIPINGLVMRKDELKIVPGSKKINAGTIDRVKEEIAKARRDHSIEAEE
jgi:hypothetical protein